MKDWPVLTFHTRRSGGDLSPRPEFTVGTKVKAKRGWDAAKGHRRARIRSRGLPHRISPPTGTDIFCVGLNARHGLGSRRSPSKCGQAGASPDSNTNRSVISSDGDQFCVRTMATLDAQELISPRRLQCRWRRPKPRSQAAAIGMSRGPTAEAENAPGEMRTVKSGEPTTFQPLKRRRR
jgi:hypothetical protein